MSIAFFNSLRLHYQDQVSSETSSETGMISALHFKAPRKYVSKLSRKIQITNYFYCFAQPILHITF